MPFLSASSQTLSSRVPQTQRCFCFISQSKPYYFRLNHAHNHTFGFPLAQNEELLDFFSHLLSRSFTLQQSQQVHTQIAVTGSHRLVFLASRLVTVYARFGLVTSARNIFDSFPIKGLGNLLLWNSILRANVSRGYYEDALELYSRMRKLGVWSDGFTFPLIIRACSFVGSSNLCRNVHCHALLSGFQNHLHVVNELIGMYGKLGRTDFARQLFDRIHVRNHISWNTMVSGYALNYDSMGASQIFQRMELEGLKPNSVTWTSLFSSHARCGQHEETIRLFDMMRVRGIESTAEALSVVLSSCSHSGAVDKSRAIHGYVIKGGYEDYVFVKNALICTYGKCGNVKDAQTIFSEMKAKSLGSWNALISCYAECGLCDEAFAIFSDLENANGFPIMRPNVISWTAIISGFASKGRGKESFELFRRMQLAKVMANCVTISSVLSVCSELAVLNLGKEIHCHVIRAWMDSNLLVGNALINMYMKCGSFKEACSIFNKIDGKDLISWNTMIDGYGMHGLGENAVRTFDEMIKSGLEPDNVTFVALLSACSHAGLVAKGRRLFNRMVTDFNMVPRMEHYSCMVDLLGRAGFLHEASNIVKNMPEEPNDYVLGSLLNSCRMYKHARVAEEIASHIVSLKSQTTGTYMLISNIYAASGRWEDSARVRVSAKTNGLKKTRGQSWIQLKNKVYTFSAGNIEQPGLDEVYYILEELTLQMVSEDDDVPEPDHNGITQHINEEENCCLWLYGFKL